MQIDWIHFTPWLSLGGGLLLGLACALFVLLNGRILGVSGILGGLLTPTRGDMAWRIAFPASSRSRAGTSTQREWGSGPGEGPPPFDAEGRILGLADAFGQAATQAPHPIHWAASIAASAEGLGTGIEFASTALPVETET